MKRRHNSLDMIMNKIWQRKIPFFLVFFFVVLTTYSVLVIIDFVPEPIEEHTREVETEMVEDAIEQVKPIDPVDVPAVADPLPVKIIFDDLDNKVVPVLNPTSKTIADLDEALLSGAVRHPDSATFEEDGNIFILGHSSYLPNVLNKNFQAFNGIQKLQWGDTIRLHSGDVEYVYIVEEIFEAAASEVVVPFTPGKARLTLATCNSFGAKDDRFVVEARLLEKKPL